VTTKLYNYYLENCDVSKRIATGGVLFILKLSKMFSFGSFLRQLVKP